MANKPISFINTKNYRQPGLDYLGARACTEEDIRIIPYATADSYFYTESPSGELNKFIAEGFALCRRLPSGEWDGMNYLVKPQNWPPETVKLVTLDNGEPKALKGNRPKHLQHTNGLDKDVTSWYPDFATCAKADVLAIHEKYTSAALMWRLLGIPCIALSGCRNWSHSKKQGGCGDMKPIIKDCVKLRPKGSRILMCLDGDMESNTTVKDSARLFKGVVNDIRPDIKVQSITPPKVGEGYIGWDDWVAMGGTAEQWRYEIEHAAKDIYVALPTEFLIEKFALDYEETRGGGRKISHSLSNYARLLTHDNWSSLCADDKTSAFFDVDDLSRGHLTIDMLKFKYRKWLETVVFSHNGGKVSSNTVVDSLEELRQMRRTNILINYLDQHLDEVEITDEEKHVVDFMDAIGITGPMTLEERKYTIPRMYRDMVGEWAGTEHPDWIGALIGPFGSGKSDTPPHMVEFFKDWGYNLSLHASLPKTGRGTEDREIVPVLSAVAIATIDEYDADESYAKELEQLLIRLSSMEETSIIRKYDRDPSLSAPRSRMFITTTKRAFIRTNPNDGAGRRFIVFDMVGSMIGRDGLKTINRPKLAEASKALCLIARKRMLNDLVLVGGTNAFSRGYMDQYVRETSAMTRLGRHVHSDEMQIRKALDTIRDQYKTVYKNRTALDLRTLIEVLCPMDGYRMPLMDEHVFLQLMVDCGAESHYGSQQWIRDPIKEQRAGGIQKEHRTDKRTTKCISVGGGDKGWDEFVDNIFARI